jgi:hypothetical protein
MTEQQYTCPKCFKDYTRFTIQEHYGCGVEPLETIEVPKQELEGIPEPPPQEEAQIPEPKKRGRKPKAK